MNEPNFVMFGIPHLVAVVVTAIVAVFMVRMHRSPKVSAQIKRRANVILAWILLISVVMDPVLAWWRFGVDPADAMRIIREISLPLYLCDVVSVILAIALLKEKQRLAEIGYLWGIAGTAQGLITPTLAFSWDSPDYYAFFIQHGGVPIAALVLVYGMALRPQPGAFQRALLWSWGYIAVVFCCNALLEANYGFLNGKPHTESLMDYMGQYPWYLITLQMIAFTLYFLLLLPFRSPPALKTLR